MKEVNESPITILAIDDEPEVLARIASILEGAGYLCHCACDAESAQEAARRCTPDVIISDVNLVGHSGLSVCQQLKEQAGIGHVPVMFLSAAQVPDIIRRAHAAGGSYYLRKPFHGPVLVQLIEKIRLMSPVRPKTGTPSALPRPMTAVDQLKPASTRAIASRTSLLASK
jgi:CheY-like chemotaxis protein